MEAENKRMEGDGKREQEIGWANEVKDWKK